MKIIKKIVTCFLLMCLMTGCTNFKDTKHFDFDDLYRNPTQYDISQYLTEEEFIFEFQEPLETELIEKIHEFDNDCKVIASFQKNKEFDYSVTLNYIGYRSSDYLKLFSPVYYDEKRNISLEDHSITVTFLSENEKYSRSIPWNVHENLDTGPKFTYNFIINEKFLNNSMNINDIESIIFEVDDIYCQKYSFG